MRNFVIRGLIVALLAALGTVALLTGRVERDLARAEEEMATLSYSGAADALRCDPDGKLA